MDFASLLSLLQVAFPGFTDRALKTLSVAQKQAAVLNHRQVTPEHLLLALAAIEPGPGRLTLERLGVDLLQDAARIESLAAAAQHEALGDHQSFSFGAEQLIAEAKAEAAGLGHRYVGTEHLVLGLLRCGSCPAGDYLRSRGVTVERFREEALRLLAG